MPSLTSVHEARPYALNQLADELTAYPVDGLDLYDGGRLRITYAVDSLPDSDLIAINQIVDSHRPDEIAQFEQLVEKARRVWRGEETFTQAQAQKILAGLVLLENRRR